MYRSVIVNVHCLSNDDTFNYNYVHIDVDYLVDFLARLWPRCERSTCVRVYHVYI